MGRWIRLFFVVGLVAAAGWAYARRADTPAVPIVRAAPGSEVSARQTMERAPVRGAEPRRRAVGFRTAALLDQHFAKHGREFGPIDRAAYLRIAIELRDRPKGGKILEIVRQDGVITRFDRSTGAFLAFQRDGTIRTLFRPRQGETYFQRQAQRPARNR